MNLNQYFLLLVNKESNEIAKEAGKAIRFGLFEHHPSQPNQTNEERINYEFIDLIATLFVCNQAGMKICIPYIESIILYPEYKEKVIEKINRIIKFMKASAFEGQLQTTLPKINELEDKIRQALVMIENQGNVKASQFIDSFQKL